MGPNRHILYSISPPLRDYDDNHTGPHAPPKESLIRMVYRFWYNPAMKVKIRLFASLRKFGLDEQEVELPDNATIDDAIDLLNLPRKIPLLRIVNGEHRPADHQLRDGDELALFPPIAGGQDHPAS